MDYSLLRLIVLNSMLPAVRGIVLFAVIVAILLCDNPVVLAAVLSVIILPLLIASGAVRLYLRFALLILSPIALALFIVWGGIVKALPGQPVGSSPTGGMIFATVITLRIALLSGLFQAIFGTMRGDKLISNLAKWGITGDLLIIILATLAIVPEGKLRADQVLTSRLARGLVKKRGWINNTRQIPYILRPMLGWTLRSAVERAELWQHRRLLERLQNNSKSGRPYLISGYVEHANLFSFSPSSYQALNTDSVNSVFSEQVSSLQQLIERIKSGKTVALIGSNFSGRTKFLRLLSGLESLSEASWSGDFRGDGAYVGPEAHSSMSGLTRTVQDELILHAAGTVESASLLSLIDALRLKDLASRNPVTLSGGEQVCVALTCALALQPQIMAIDCAFEQLDQHLRAQFLNWVSNHKPQYLAMTVADNRFDELAANEVRTFSSIQFINGHLNGIENTHISSLTKISSVSGSKVNYLLSSSPFELRANNISFSYGSSREVLRDISLTLSPGNTYILEGANGSGKSTLAKLFCGVLKKNSGLFYRNGKIYNPWKIPGRHVAYHFQNPDVQIFGTTVLDEIASGARSHNFKSEIISQYTEHMLEIFGLKDFSNYHPLDLPFVLRKRVAIAATLASGCPWVILDEPTLGQDQESCYGLLQMIKRASLSGVGFILISHSSSFKKGLKNPVTLSITNGSIRTGEIGL
jgi:energy-coupling factor transport system ATP-binding protein